MKDLRTNLGALLAPHVEPGECRRVVGSDGRTAIWRGLPRLKSAGLPLTKTQRRKLRNTREPLPAGAEALLEAFSAREAPKA